MGLITNSNNKGRISRDILFKKPKKTDEKNILVGTKSYEKKRFKGYLIEAREAGVRSVDGIGKYVKKEHGIKEKNKLMEKLRAYYNPATGLTDEQKKANIKVSRRLTELLSNDGSSGFSGRATSNIVADRNKKRGENIGGRFSETSIDKNRKETTFGGSQKKETVASVINSSNKKTAGVTQSGNSSPVSPTVHKSQGIKFP